MTAMSVGLGLQLALSQLGALSAPRQRHLYTYAGFPRLCTNSAPQMTFRPLSILLFATATTSLLGWAWRRACSRPPIWIRQLEQLGKPRDKLLPGTVVICGGSVAGILSARVCADHFERVLIVEPDIENPGRRISQWSAAHIYLCLFTYGARRLWSNFDEVAKSFGGRIVPADLQVHYSGVEVLGPVAAYPNGNFPNTLLLRRAGVQKTLHRLLLRTKETSRGSISIVCGTVRGFQPTPDKSAVESVTIRKADGELHTARDIALLIDCSGKAQAGFKWLQSAYPEVSASTKSSYNPNLRYQTCTFTLTSEAAARLPIPARLRESLITYAYAPHDDTKSCFIGLVMNDGNAVQIIFGDTGMGGLPDSPEEVLPFIARFRGAKAPIPGWVLETIQMLVDEGEPYFDPINLNTLTYIKYHQIRTASLPSNFVAVGDAFLSLNPVHGQGFAKAMLNSITLNALLHSMAISGSASALPHDFSTRYFKNSAPAMDGLWDATRIHDYGSPACVPAPGEVKNTLGGRITRYLELKLVSAATQSPEVASALWHVRHMLADERVFLGPGMVWRVLVTPSIF
ncbi:hypothetical protein MKEN_00143300 [Mycena kentingensis (nom. inval.)]|nr:hypothetical protein MKEN_00143300 [Mycena kentingensis (nom. inval.)]